MDTPDQPQDQSPRLASIPMFAQPRQERTDDLPPESHVSPPAATWSPESDPESNRPEPESPSDDDWESPRTTTSTRPRLKPGGNPREVAKVLGGLIVLLTATLGVLAARQGKEFRQPTPAQRDDIANPLARIAVRHLPLDAIGDDLADLTEAAVASHSYVMDGPLIASARAKQSAGEYTNLDQE